MPIPEKKKSYTFADILEMDEDIHVEIIDGELYMMGTPSTKHQRISTDLIRQFSTYLRGKKCEVFAAPFAVRLFEKEGDKPWQVGTYVEPDITVICNPDKLDDYGCKGAPDLVIEILSPSGKKHDMHIKYIQYQKAGVPEYWIVDPDACTVSVLTLKEDGLYCAPMVYTHDSIVPVGVLEDCNIDLSTVFAGM